MKLLALETATEACSAALYIDGELNELYELAPRRHAELILPMADALLKQAGMSLSQMDAIAVGRGPGAFTGVRIAISVAQGIAFGADLPVLPISSLAALAQGMYRETGYTHALAAMDARMHEVYYGLYVAGDKGVMQACAEEGVRTPHELDVPEAGPWYGVGSAWSAYAPELSTRLGDGVRLWREDFFPRARDVAALAAKAYLRGEAVSAEAALPVYLRDKVAEKARAPK